MKYFFLDTSNSHLTVAIYKNKTLLAGYNKPCDNKLSADIMPIIDEVFKKAGTSLWDIDKIFVVIGPGSFTGIRIGVTIAKTLAWASNTEIVPISSLEFMATTKVRTPYTVPIIDARRGYVYAGVYDKKLNKISEDQYISLEDLKKQLGNTKYTIVSYDEINEKKLYPNININMILKKHLNDKSVNPHLINPSYLKLTEAEEKLKHAS